MKKIRFEYLTVLKFGCSVSGHYFSVRCVPQSTARQKITSLDVMVFPKVKTWENTDSFGNRIISGRYDYQHANFSFGISGTAVTDCTAIDKTGYMECYRFPTALTTAGKELTDFYSSIKDNSGMPVYERAMNLSRMLYEVFEYAPNSTNIKTSAEQAFIQKKGVCQDYAHILLALLRLDNIPCRYAAGISPGEGETHGWVEIYDNGWIGIDPTHNCRVNDNYLRITHGRDFADCAIDRGVLFGGYTAQYQTVSAFLTDE